MEKIKRPKIIRQTNETKLTVLSGLFVCFGVILPYVTFHAYGLKGNVFLPMHIPVILCGFFCGAKRGFLCGIITPLLSSLTTNMPAIYPMLPIMTVELSMYGFMSGFLFSKGLSVIPSLAISMVLGRACYAVMFYFLLLGDPSLQTIPNPILASMPVLSAFYLGIPGMIIQMFLIPTIVNRLRIRTKR